MRCRDVHDLASAYLDAELDDARASALRGHVRVCPACLALVRDLAAVRDTMAGLAPVEPSPSLWTAVERGLAAAEIADAGRSRLWLRWQQLRHRLLPATVAMAAITAAVMWLVRHPAFLQDPAGAARAPVAERVADRSAPLGTTLASMPPAPVVVSAAAEAGDMASDPWALAPADQHYEGAIADLRQLVAAERARWPVEASTRFDSRLAAFQAEARRHQETLEQAAEPRGRDDLYAVYRAEIDFLQNAAIYGAEAVQHGGEGGP